MHSQDTKSGLAWSALDSLKLLLFWACIISTSTWTNTVQYLQFRDAKGNTCEGSKCILYWFACSTPRRTHKTQHGCMHHSVYWQLNSVSIAPATLFVGMWCVQETPTRNTGGEGASNQVSPPDTLCCGKSTAGMCSR